MTMPASFFVICGADASPAGSPRWWRRAPWSTRPAVQSGRCIGSVPGGSGRSSAYAELSRQIQDAGLLGRRYGWYWSRMIATKPAFVVIWVAFFVIGDAWLQVYVAAVLAVAVPQFGFLGYDAAHRQIFASARWNEWGARVMSAVFAGLTYGWWTHSTTETTAARTRRARTPTSRCDAMSGPQTSAGCVR